MAIEQVSEKTAVNSGPTKIDENLLKLKPDSELEPGQGKRLQEEAESYSSFVSKHENILEKYMSTEFTSLEKREDFLMKHADIIFHEHAVGRPKLNQRFRYHQVACMSFFFLLFQLVFYAGRMRFVERESTAHAPPNWLNSVNYCKEKPWSFACSLFINGSATNKFIVP